MILEWRRKSDIGDGLGFGKGEVGEFLMSRGKEVGNWCG